MKKAFVTPQVELISMDQADVIATSESPALRGITGGGKARIVDCSELFATNND